MENIGQARLVASPLRFPSPSPPSGWVEDFQLKAVDPVFGTKKEPVGSPALW
jgi:hypothetical protein